MTPDLPTLLFFSIAVLALSAGVMTMFGATRRVYRGFWWWVAAQWLLVLGLLLHGLRGSLPGALPLANLLMLQWPIVVLAGMRRFWSRRAFALPASADGLLLALCFVVWLAAWSTDASIAIRVATFAGAAMLLHLYGAWLLGRIGERRGSLSLRLMIWVELGVAIGQGARLVVALSESGAPAGSASLALVGSGLMLLVAPLVMMYLGLLLSCERTENDLRANQRKLRYLADIDMLTRVPNRRHFHELAGQALARGEPAAATLVMFDVDHFKRINDLLGHATGDEALRQVATVVRETLRDNDVAGRLGGDEFAMLLPGTTVNDAMAVATRVAAALEHRQVAPRTARLSLSFGVVGVNAGESIADALRRADQALYEAKRQGRSRAVVASGLEGKPVFGESRSLGLGSS